MTLKKSVGNMYTWVTHTHSHLRGQCPHGCRYCYAQNHERRFHTGAFAGPVRIEENELKVRYNAPAVLQYARNRGFDQPVIFIEHTNDLFAADVPESMISEILRHCCEYPDTRYVFQTKTPHDVLWFMDEMPTHALIGTTIETNRVDKDIMGKAPTPMERASGMFLIKDKMPHVVTFCTIEPIMDFDVEMLAGMIASIQPSFVNIGADSKGHHLPEPPFSKVQDLIAHLEHDGIVVRRKTNLERLERT